MDPGAFRSEHPALCEVPESFQAIPATARELPLSAESIGGFSVSASKDPDALPNMIKLGTEAVGRYHSFRFQPERWGFSLSERGIRTLKEEWHRIIWRDLGKYADRPIDDVLERVEYTLVLDYLIAHLKVHYAVDAAAATLEAEDGTPRYAPYVGDTAERAARPPQGPKDIPNLEEALANLEAFRNYINPGYGESISKFVEGRLDERNVQEWKAFFVGGRFAVEMANTLSRQPPGWKDFTKLVNRRTSVGSTNYVRIQYLMDMEALERTQKEISRRIAGLPEGTDLGSVDNLLVAEFPPIPVYVY